MSTAPKTCDFCGANLDAGETCTCQQPAEEAVVQTDASTMEFVMGTSLETLPATIDFNYLELKAGLTTALERYNALVVTEDGIKAAKEDRAKLNKLRDALEAKRKEIKKDCMAPYMDFERKVKELVGLIDAPIRAIDGQLKGFEERRRAEKRQAIEDIYEDTVGELRGILPFDRVWRDEWYNTGFSMKKIREAMTATESKVASDIEVLSTVESEFMEAVKLKYLEALDLNAALAERARLREQADRLREYEAQRAAEAARTERAPEVTRPDNAPCEAQEDPCKAEEERTVYRLRFECFVTREQAAELSAWLKARNINYRRI